jgi:hypothetical protein
MMRRAMQSICVLMLVSATHLSSAQEPQSVPRDVLAVWSYSIGDWDVDGRIGSTPVHGSATFEWANGRHCYTGRQTWKIGESDRAVHLTLIGGWNDAAQETVEQGFASSGSSATVHYRVAAEKGGTIEGDIEGSEAGGARWSGEIQVERKGSDEFQLTTTVDGEIVHSLKYVRTKGDSGTRSESASAQPTPIPSQTPVKQQPTTQRSKTAFNPLPLDNDFTRWIVGAWVGTGESDAGSGRGTTRVEMALNGQFLIFTGEAKVTNISAEQRQYLKSQLHATDEEIERFKSMPFRGLELYTVDQETGEVVGYMFDSLRCIATGRGEWEANTQTMHWKWATGHKSTRITRKLSDDRLAMVERIAMPDGSTMEESGEMVRKK